MFWHGSVRVVSSKTLAAMCGRNHSDMMKSIRVAYRLVERPRRTFIEIGGGEGRTKEILVTVKGFKALLLASVKTSPEVAEKVSAAFGRRRRGAPSVLEVPTPPEAPVPPTVPAPEVPVQPTAPLPTALTPVTTEEMLRRFTKAMAVMMGVDPDEVSGLMQKGGAL